MDQMISDWVAKERTGCILFLSPSKELRLERLYTLAGLALCKNGGCGECNDCQAVAEKTHPSLVQVDLGTFERRMNILYSVSTPVVLFVDVQAFPFNKQTQMLIWLETKARQRLVLMSAESEHRLLPTIRSRSMSFREIPKEVLSEEDSHRVRSFLQTLWSGRVSLENLIDPIDNAKLARQMQLVVVSEVEGRLARKPKMLPGSPADLYLLLKLLDRYLQDPAVHNFQLLLSSFATSTVQAIR